MRSFELCGSLPVCSYDLSKYGQEFLTSNVESMFSASKVESGIDGWPCRYFARSIYLMLRICAWTEAGAILVIIKPDSTLCGNAQRIPALHWKRIRWVALDL